MATSDRKTGGPRTLARLPLRSLIGPAGERYLIGLIDAIIRVVLHMPSGTIRKCTLKLLGATVERSAWIYGGCEVRAPWRLSLGEGTSIGHRCVLDARGGLSFGQHVNVGTDAQFWTMDHDPASPTFASRRAPVEVGNRAWISARVTVLPGVTIGEGAVVAAGAVVIQDVEPWTIVGGVPAKKIQDRPTNDYRLGRPTPFY